MDSYSLMVIGIGGLCGRPNYAEQAEAFLKARIAVESFYWTPFDTDVQVLFMCRSWSMHKIGGLYQLTVTFEQVPR